MTVRQQAVLERNWTKTGEQLKRPADTAGSPTADSGVSYELKHARVFHHLVQPTRTLQRVSTEISTDREITWYYEIWNTYMILLDDF